MKNTYRKRRDALRRKLCERNLDAMLISYAANRYYLSGFELHDVQFNETAGYLLVAADGRDMLLTDGRYEEVAESLLPGQVRIYRHNKGETVAGALRSLGKKIAYEADALSAKFASELFAYASDLAFVPGDSLVSALRLIKDAQEIAALERSFALNHALLSWIETELAFGQSETEIAWKIESYFREHGASELAFPSIVAVNANASLPHAQPGASVVTEPSLVLIDVGCRVDGYCSDQTRTFWLGSTRDERFETTKARVAEAQRAAIDAMKPGVRLCDIAAKAKAVFEKYGVADAFLHSLGHGVGLETHEGPSFAKNAEDVLLPGMVVTVEPGLYYPNWGGVRIEHTVLVEENGVRVL